MIRKDNLVLHMKLNGAKDSSGNVLDFSGNNRSGVVTGTEQYTDGSNGKKYFDFDGSTYITCSNTASCCQTNKKTIVVKTKIDTLTSAATWISKGSSTDTSFAMDYSGTTIRAFGYNSLAAPKLISITGSDYLNKDVIMTLVFDTNSLKFYIDKELVGSTNAADKDWEKNNTNISIGARGASGLSVNPQSDVLVFDNVSFSQTEVEKMVDELKNPAEFSPKIVGSLSTNYDGEYIDTGKSAEYEVSSDGNLEVDVTFKSKLNNPNNIIIGRDFSKSWYVNFGSSGNLSFYTAGSATTAISQVPSNKVVNFKCVYNNGSKKIYKNGEEVASGIGTINPDSTNAFIFKSPLSSTFSQTTIYDLKVKIDDVLISHFIPLPDGTMIDIVNNVIYSNQGTGTLTYKQEALTLDDESLIFSTRDGVKDLTGKSGITSTNAIVGKGVVLSSGTIGWDSLTPTSYVYVWEDASGNIKHYGYNGTLYTNGIAGGSQPITVGATGISSATGKLHFIKIYNEVKSEEFIKDDYNKEVRFW